MGSIYDLNLRQVRFRIAALVAALVFSCHPPLLAKASPLVLILSSHHAQPYDTVRDAFKNHLSNQEPDVHFEQWFLDGDAGKPTEVLERIKQIKSVVVFAIGGAAAKTAQREAPDHPIVASLVVDLGGEQGSRNTTGVLLAHSWETHFEWLTRMCPVCKRVGILHGPSAGQSSRNSAISAAAAKFDLKLTIEEITNPKELPKAVGRLVRRTDVLWPLPDEILLAPHVAKAILLTSFRNRIPVIGPSSAWVKAGAIYALDWDYEELGQASADLVAELLHGERLSDIQPRLPRNVRYSLNLKTAKHMRWTFTDEIEKGAATVFR